jgi:hypothetical protein
LNVSVKTAGNRRWCHASLNAASSASSRRQYASLQNADDGIGRALAQQPQELRARDDPAVATARTQRVRTHATHDNVDNVLKVPRQARERRVEERRARRREVENAVHDTDNRGREAVNRQARVKKPDKQNGPKIP